MASYPIPPWIKPPEDAAQAYTSAFHAGAQVAGEHARLQMEANQQATHFAVQQQQLQMENLRAQQTLEMQKALHQATIGIRQQQLQQAQEKIQLTAQNAAHKLAAEQEVRAKMESGMPMEQAYLTTPGLFSSASGLGSLAKSYEDRMHPFQPYSLSVDGHPGIMQGPKRWERTIIPPESVSDIHLGRVYDAEGKIVKGAGARMGSKGEVFPYTFPKEVDPNAAAFKDLVKDHPAWSALARRNAKPNAEWDKSTKEQYQGFKEEYDRLKPKGEITPPDRMSATNAPAGVITPPASLGAKSGGFTLMRKKNGGPLVKVPSEKVAWALEHEYIKE